MNEESRDIYYKKSGNASLCRDLFQQATDEIILRGGMSNAHQQEALLNHIAEMVKRAVTKERITPIDKSLFYELSQESFRVSKRIVNRLGDLPEDEIYLLAVHFEVINKK